jgi:RND superfamily putative drug exporter
MSATGVRSVSTGAVVDAAEGRSPAGELGRLGRLGRWTAGHGRTVLAIWAVLVAVLAAFAPRVESALSGAGWEASGSPSVQARQLVDEHLGGVSSTALMVVVHARRGAGAPLQEVIAAVQRALRATPHVGRALAPRPGTTLSRDGRTAIVIGTAAGDANEMVAAADDLKDRLPTLHRDGIAVHLTGASGLWSDFNHANLTAMLRSEVLSWPITLAILVVAFGSLVAAGLPLLLTITGLVAAAGSLFLGAQLLDISVWAFNFAMMFALALGIDYALFLVMRFRAARRDRPGDPVAAVAQTMDTAGKAVLLSGLTVLISLTAVLLVPSPAFRSMALGIMLAVVFVLAATLTLLPAVLARLDGRIDRGALPRLRPAVGRSARFERWADGLWRRPWRAGLAVLLLLVLLAVPMLGLRTGMPSIAVVPAGDGSRVGYAQVQQAFGPGAPGQLQLVARAADVPAVARLAAADPGIAAVTPAFEGTGGLALIGAVPSVDPSDPALGSTIDRLRAALPSGTLVGGQPAENHDLEAVLADRTPLVVGVVLVLGFLLLLVALQAPVLAAVGVATNLLAVAAAFGVARLVFQDGHLSGLLGFSSQGFLDAWAPVFFFAMVFAISMDYTVFLLSTAKERWDATRDAREATVGGLALSGRVVLAAAAVMVAVFLTFAISGPIPPKEMGVVLGVAVLLDAFLVRLVLLPVAMRLLGARAWWAPRWLRRLLPEIRFGH